MLKTKVEALVKSYLKLTTWYELHDGDQSITVDQFEAVANEIGRLEEQLSANGISDTAISELLKLVKQQEFIHKPLDELSEDQQLKLFKAIFGEDTTWQI